MEGGEPIVLENSEGARITPAVKGKISASWAFLRHPTRFSAVVIAIGVIVAIAIYGWSERYKVGRFGNSTVIFDRWTQTYIMPRPR